MIRIGKMTDYGMLLLSTFAQKTGKTALTARDLAQSSQLPLPTVSKLLKLLCKADILISQRGVNGGYRLGRLPSEITVVEVVELLEGPIAMTDCSTPDSEPCEREATCPVCPNWQQVTRYVRSALERLTLAEIVDGHSVSKLHPNAGNLVEAKVQDIQV